MRCLIKNHETQLRKDSLARRARSQKTYGKGYVKLTIVTNLYLTVLRVFQGRRKLLSYGDLTLNSYLIELVI